MKTERDFGREYAWAIGATEPVNIEEMVTGTIDIPTEDFLEMIRSGIENPDAREYWRGYNSICA